MKTNEQRIMLMHKKAYRIRRKNAVREIMISGICTLGLLIFIAGYISFMDGDLHIIGEAGFSGNSMLADDVGGYVLVGVIAFVVAVVFTLVCFKIKEKGRSNGKDGLNERLNAMSKSDETGVD